MRSLSAFVIAVIGAQAEAKHGKKHDKQHKHQKFEKHHRHHNDKAAKKAGFPNVHLYHEFQTVAHSMTTKEGEAAFIGVACHERASEKFNKMSQTNYVHDQVTDKVWKEDILLDFDAKMAYVSAPAKDICLHVPLTNLPFDSSTSGSRS